MDDDMTEDFPQPLNSSQRLSLDAQAHFHYRQCISAKRAVQQAEHHVRTAKASVAECERQLEDLQRTAPAASQQPVERRNEDGKRPREECGGEDITKAVPKRRGLQRGSAAFSAFAGFLDKARKDDDNKGLREQREAIARKTQSDILRRELMTAHEALQKATDRVAEARHALDAARRKRKVYTTVLDGLEEAESEYCSAFFLRAAGDEEDDVANFDIFFLPSRHTEETRSMVCAQVEEALQRYLPFRALVDPLLIEIAAWKEERDRQQQVQHNGGIGSTTEQGLLDESDAGMLMPPPQIVFANDADVALLRPPGYDDQGLLPVVFGGDDNREVAASGTDADTTTRQDVANELAAFEDE